MSKRRILIVTNRVPFPLKDGGALAMDAMINGYQKQGWQVALLAMNTSRHPVAQTTVNGLYPSLFRFDAVPVDTSIRSANLLTNLLFSTKPEHAGRFFHLNFKDRLLEIIKEFDPQAIQMESIYLHTYIPHIRKIAQVPIVQRLHNIEYQVWERLAAETRNIFKKKYLTLLAKRIKKFEIKVWKKADLLLPITKTDEAVIRAHGITTPVRYAPFGFDAQLPQLSQPAENWIGYHIGAMDWLPNEEAVHWFLKDIWPLVISQLPAFQFHFAGRNMQDHFKQLKIDNVFCAGEVADAKEFISDKQILIVPLRSAGGIRVKIMEAMMAGKLVISTATGMQGIDALGCRHYLQANDPEEFAAAIKWSVENKEEAIKIALAGRLLMQQSYSQVKIMECVIQRLEKLI